jgi:hypothetical protein
MGHTHLHRLIGILATVGRLATAVLLVAGVTTVVTTPAAAAPAAVGYVRLAHLSPDTPEVDVYLSKIGDSSFKEQVFTHVGYGVMSKYLALPVGTYSVAMRQQGAPASSAPVLTTQVTVQANQAYTVAGVGKFAGLGLEVLTDDLRRPAGGKSKVRIIQASVASPVLDVARADGTSIAQDVAFASTTAYQVVDPGTWTLKLTPSGSAKATTVSCLLASGSVYSLLVLDSDNGLVVELRHDARGGASVPDGGVETGDGGRGLSPTGPLVLLGLALLVGVGLLAVALRMRRLATRHT